jgi:hypothetical protein
MFVNAMPYDCDVGEIAGGAQRYVMCSPVGDSDSGRSCVGRRSLTTKRRRHHAMCLPARASMPPVQIARRHVSTPALT